MTTEPLLLLVEDNATDEELTLRALRKAKIAANVVVARDGAEALEYLFSTGKYAGSDHPLPQVVLLDLNLPKLGGLEVLRRIRGDPRMSVLRVVVLTSSSEHRDVMGCYQSGADSYVVKPVDSTAFFEAVAGLARYWLIINVPAEKPGHTADPSQPIHR